MLASITKQLGSSSEMAKTLDMKGREAAVKLISVSVTIISYTSASRLSVFVTIYLQILKKN